MRTLPAHFLEHSRDASEFNWLVDIEPSAADSWSQIRWGERELVVDGNSYAGGFLQGIDTIKNKVNIFGGGAVATRDNVTISVLDKDRSLFRMIQERNMDGRNLQVSLAMFPLNRVRNSSFEAPTSGNNFDHWTETPGHGSNTITRQTSGPYEGAQYARLTSVGSPLPTIESAAFTVPRGATVSLSFAAKASSGGQSVRAKILWNGLYWNNTTRQWQGGATHVTFTLTTSWARYTLENVYAATEPIWMFNSFEAPMSIIFEADATGQTIDVDAVQLEERLRASSYHRGRYDMKAAEIYPLYWGEVRAPKWDNGTVRLATRSIMNRRQRDIPITLINQGINSDWVIPPDNLGKPFPMTYGNFQIDQTNERFPRKGAAAAGVVVNEKNTPVKVLVYFDRPGMDMMTAGTVYIFSPESQRFYREFFRASGQSEWFPNNADAYMAADSGGTDWLSQGLIPISLMLYGVSTGAPIGYSDDRADFTNPDNVVDEDLDSYAGVQLVNSPTHKDLFVDVQKPQEFAGVYCFGAHPLAKVEAVLVSGSVTRRINFVSYIPGQAGIINAGGAVPGTICTGPPFYSIPEAGTVWDANEDDFPFNLSNEESERRDAGFWLNPERRYLITCDNVSGTGTVAYELYGIGLRLDVVIPLTEALIFRTITGRVFGDTWGGRKTASTVIVKPPDILEGILRHELGMVTADINTASFDQAITDYGSRGNMAGQVTEVKSSVDVLDEICKFSGIVYYVDGAGKEALRVLKHGASAKRLRPRDFSLNRIDFEYLDRDEIVSSFSLKWGYVPGGDVYLGHTYCNRSDSNFASGASTYEGKCASAYAKLGNRENHRDYECRWINSEADAESLLKWLIEWTTARRRLAKATGYLDQLDLEFGDRVDLQLEDYLLERDTDSTRPVFVPYETAIRKTNKQISVDISFLEVIAP